MGWRSLVVPMMILAAGVAALAQAPTYGLGRAASTEEIRAADIAVGPSGKELPPGSGSAKEGATLYVQKGCAGCHGPNGIEGQAPRLMKGKDTLKPGDVLESWPFATTVWDYINRAMPLSKGGTLKPDEVYALTAFLLYKNEIIGESDVLDAQSLPKVRMPNRDGYQPPPLSDWKPGMPRPFRIIPDR